MSWVESYRLGTFPFLYLYSSTPTPSFFFEVQVRDTDLFEGNRKEESLVSTGTQGPTTTRHISDSRPRNYDLGPSSGPRQ